MAKSKVTSVELRCGNPGCANIFYRSPKEIRKVSQSFCSQSCAARVNNQKRTPKLKLCVNAACRNVIRGDKRYCSQECISLARTTHSPKELLGKLITISKKLGRTPTRREMGPISDMCVRAFGSWNDAIIAAGLSPHRSASDRMYHRMNTKASDGHSCDSISEAIIDNWLTKNSVEHMRNTSYPSTGHKADWGIKDNIFIEYFGLAKDSPRYDRAVLKKRELCNQNGIRLIELYPEDLYPTIKLEKKLESVL